MSDIIKNLGGSLFIHNAVEFDYCIMPAIQSIAEICEQVIIIDAESTDKTKDILRELKKGYDNLEIYDAKWECAENYLRLPILANKARERLKTKWHFMLQADEVLHEESIESIKRICSLYGFSFLNEAFRVRRINVYGRFDLKVKYCSNRKPCGDSIVRLALTKYQVYGDAENIHHNFADMSFQDKIIIFHYGYMRKPMELLNKGISMTSWFGINGIDNRLIEMKNNQHWDPYKIIPITELDKIPLSHPKYANNWIQEREKYYQ